VTLCTSDINEKSRMEKTAFVYFMIALFCVLFGAVYEVFSHEVYSFFMIYAFAFPLVGGTLPFWLLARKDNVKYPGAVARNLYHSGIATFTVGSIIRGVLDIYGTTNVLSGFYFGAGGIFVLAGVILFAAVAGKDKKN